MKTRWDAERLDRAVFPFACFSIVAAVVLLGAHTIPNVNVTWDEAGQFWMTQGQAFATPWETPKGSLIEGLELGRSGNILDPVGFTSLLWAWVALFGAEPATLRALPFLAFLGALLASYLLGRNLMGQYRTPSLVIPSAILTSYLSLQWSTEIRPYSMELLGVIAIFALTLNLVRNPSWTSLISLITTCGFFLVFSRYSFSFATAASVSLIVLALMKSRTFALHLRKIALGTAFLLVIGLFLMWNIGIFDEADQVWENYGNPIQVRSIDDFVHMRMLIQINFIYGWHKLTGVFLILGLVALLLGRSRNSRHSIAAIRDALESGQALWLSAWIFVASYEVAAALASQLGLAQWNSEFRHSIGLLGIAVISGFGLLVLGRAFLSGIWVSQLKPRCSNFAKLTLEMVAWVVWIGILTVFSVLSIREFSDFRRTNTETLGVSIPTRAASALAEDSEVRWVTELLLFPSLRYLVQESGVELGSLNIENVEVIGTYGHNPEEVLAWWIEANLCTPNTTTAVLVAESLQKNEDIIQAYSDEIAKNGCFVQGVYLSDVESLMIVRERT